ncbi:hypothetical protein FQN57_000034 [Myotisia sp. PD_48]|nr:hypothetical protein FQN57_000034 [Myotisia sp. PD_48]
MGKPRLIILIRHAQSEGNKNRDIHQTVPDHRIKLTSEGYKQALEAGTRLRAMLRPDDKLHFFTSPYRRTRETTEGILKSLTSDNPSPSPFPRQTIKVYEEPRLREQDFGNFQPCSAEMERMWEERADYGHFFYRIPNGESAADAYDRVSGFNESLWRQFGEDDFASVCVLVTHGLMTRVFLMKWYHFSVEYFEDLRNINHCEFVVMQKDPDNGKYHLETKLRTWSELKIERELAARATANALIGDEHALANTSAHLTMDSPVPPRRWGGCPDGCEHGMYKYGSSSRQQSHQRASTRTTPSTETEMAEDDDQGREGDQENTGRRSSWEGFSLFQQYSPKSTIAVPHKTAEWDLTPPVQTDNGVLSHGLDILSLGVGRDAGGSQSGATSRVSISSEKQDEQSMSSIEAPYTSTDFDHATSDKHGSETAQPVPIPTRGSSESKAMANSLGDRDDDESRSAEISEEDLIQDEKRRGQSIQESVF